LTVHDEPSEASNESVLNRVLVFLFQVNPIGLGHKLGKSPDNARLPVLWSEYLRRCSGNVHGGLKGEYLSLRQVDHLMLSINLESDLVLETIIRTWK